MFSTTSVRSNTRGSIDRGYDGDAEVFLVYCPATDQIYAVPVDEAPAAAAVCGLSPPATGKPDGIRWARDYELPA